MNLREVTVGRSKDCDIYLDPRCRYASSHHGTIYYDGNQLMFRDTSSNGTMINNVSVKHRAVPIHRGDIIMLAGKYQINWNQIDSFFPYTSQQPKNIGTIAATNVINIGAGVSTSAAPNLHKWNWGAFFLSWIWGLFNGCWWLLPINLLLIICSFIPVVNIFTGLISLGVIITCGIKGTSWAWNNRSWSSVQDFEQTQSTWAKVGIGLFCFSILMVILSVLFFMSALTAMFY